MTKVFVKMIFHVKKNTLMLNFALICIFGMMLSISNVIAHNDMF